MGIFAADESGPGNGRLIAGVDSPVVREVLDEMDGKLFTTVETFGLSEDAKWQARNINFAGDLNKFAVYHEGERLGRI